MVNQKRIPVDTISCLAMESPGQQTASQKIWSIGKTPVNVGPSNRQEDPVPTS